MAKELATDRHRQTGHAGPGRRIPKGLIPSNRTTIAPPSAISWTCRFFNDLRNAAGAGVLPVPGREAVAVPSCMVFLLIGSSPSLPHAGDCSRHWPSARR